MCAYRFHGGLNESSNGACAGEVFLIDVIDPPGRCFREMRIVNHEVGIGRVIHTSPSVEDIPSTICQGLQVWGTTIWLPSRLMDHE